MLGPVRVPLCVCVSVNVYVYVNVYLEVYVDSDVFLPILFSHPLQSLSLIRPPSLSLTRRVAARGVARR